MNDRMLGALAAAGLDTTPLSLLDHASAQVSTLFALYDQELVYLEGAKSSRVALRDVTRIHSDREGVLRVETSARTAVTASLLGYDPGRVQTFFQQVRDVTARAKELPVLPLSSRPAGVGSGAGASPLAESHLPGSSLHSLDKTDASTLSASTLSASMPSASMPGVSAYTPAPATDAAVPVAVPAAPMVIAPVPHPASTLSAATRMPTPAQDGLSADGPGMAASPVAPTSGAAPPLPASALMPAGAVHAAVPRPEPVVISSMPPVSALPAFQERAGERNRQANRAAPVAEVPASRTPGTQTLGTQPGGTQRTGIQGMTGTRTSTELQPAREPQASGQAPASAVRGPDVPASAHTQGPLVSVPAANSDQDTGLHSELLRRADGVHALARTVGLLAVVLGLAALGLAYFQWNAGTSLSALWTLLTGGVGTVALLAFAEALRLLSALARSQRA